MNILRQRPGRLQPHQLRLRPHLPGVPAQVRDCGRGLQRPGRGVPGLELREGRVHRPLRHVRQETRRHRRRREGLSAATLRELSVRQQVRGGDILVG